MNTIHQTKLSKVYDKNTNENIGNTGTVQQTNITGIKCRIIFMKHTFIGFSIF